MSKDTEAKCPCCQGSLEHYPDQDGACDWRCVRCGWSEHVPGSDTIAAALTLTHARNGKKQPDAPPTLVITVEDGVVQAVQGDAPVRVVVCDFDNLELCGPKVGGKSCTIDVWDAPEKAGPQFNEILRAAAAQEKEEESK